MKYILANWKMYLREFEQAALCRRANLIKYDAKKLRLVLCPSHFALPYAKNFVKKPNEYGAQNFFWESRGAFTGEASPQDLTDFKCHYVIIGHSERRTLLNETDGMVRKKVAAALSAKLTPILCVGETLDERNSGHALERVREELREDLKGLTAEEIKRIIVAYEPVWAIGAGQPIAPTEAVEMHRRIRETIGEIVHGAVPQAVIYGGSVDAKNVRDFIIAEGVDGCLVGGASTKFDSLKQIVDIVQKYS
ncbi:MAG: triosephosphate isomerase [Candidatus Magasanikbacteria bacterium]|nr:triosephosphate isomerase [Candidatus Magasanikbacteria bacterium]